MRSPPLSKKSLKKAEPTIPLTLKNRLYDVPPRPATASGTPKIHSKPVTATPDTKERLLSRDVAAKQIPSGESQTLVAGTRLFIHQTLGGSYTVQTDFGLFRIDGKDGDALGEQVADHSLEAATLADGSPDPAVVWAQLHKVFDPEIPVNIVDLGLVYSMDIEKKEETGGDQGSSAGGDKGTSLGGYRVLVAMTLTAPGCGMGPAIAEDAKSKILLVPGVDEAEVRITWEPPWNQSMISEEGKMKLGLI